MTSTFAIVVQAIGLVLSGLLAGEEFIVRWGVQPALSHLDDASHVRARVALVKRLKIVVPALMVPTVLVAIAVIVMASGTDGVFWRWAGLVALIGFVLFSFLGTVPLNIKVNDWDVENPPSDWKQVVDRWQLIDVFRSSAAILSFALFVIAVVVQLG